jgi:hypothetical protein
MSFLNNIFGKNSKDTKTSNLPPPPQFDNLSNNPGGGMNSNQDQFTNNNGMGDQAQQNNSMNQNNFSPNPPSSDMDDNIPMPNLDLDIPPPPDFDMDLDSQTSDDSLNESGSVMVEETNPQVPNFESPQNSDSMVQEAAPTSSIPEISEPKVATDTKEIIDDTPKVNFDENTPSLSNDDSKELLGQKEVEEKRSARFLTNGPIFTKVDDYKLILESSDEIKTSLKDCDEILKRLNEIKIEEDREYDKWKKMLLDIYRKVNYIDKTCFKEVN